MPIYITLLNYTQKGVERIKNAPHGLEEAKKVFDEMGGKIREFYSVMGQYDAVVISEVPTDDIAAKIALKIVSMGNIRSETMRAYTEDEYRRIIKELP
ncbi:GYD domain-containing protein [candidate division KSB1 bacterium]